MNIEKHLILINGEDKTESISYCAYENGSWKVNFGTGKTYSYKYQSIEWYRNPNSLEPTQKVVFQNNKPLSGIKKLYIFEKHIRICFVTGYKKVYERHEIIVEQNVLSNPDAHNCLEYLKQISKVVGVTNEEESSFLYKQYEKITNVRPDSVLAQYLNPGELNKTPSGQMPIFPFGFNLSQNIMLPRSETQKTVA